ncbi:GNAT family N-acetyltransferase [Ornithinibacillus bavariensis]|uniref:GNAT family N-acetyltransferase n=1 Tax=Ornithinibacillus bavariensis TaxID=545502 RepID=UPI000ED834A2|nr:GNAT family N-acetyltransferase [Ornithinibacillus sp.]
MNITFENIETKGHVIKENDLYKHYHYPEMLTRYDSNFIAFKRMPTMHEFKEAEVFLRNFHVNNGQNHVKFLFPPNQNVSVELVEYFNMEGYTSGINELYAINPANFPMVSENPNIQVEKVNAKNYEEYLKLQYDQEIQFGENFAKEKVKLHQLRFHSNDVVQFIVFYQDKPVGAVDVILSEGIAEIDNLFVIDSMQRKGIGSQLQRNVMDLYQDRTVILIADGKDTPREMYQKQNYQLMGFQCEVLKVY